MSGIAGIVRFDGGPVEPDLVVRMTAAMAFRGPDGIRHRVEGPVALGHCLLRTTPESLEEAQPLATGDGRVLLVFDGRIDNRTALRREVERRGERPRDGSDAELVLCACATWGRDFVPHLEGDFALFVWDARTRTAICARDRLGNRPFHYHWRDGVFSFASDLSGLLALPWVTRELNEGFLAEALAGEWHSRDETFWGGVLRLVAAHRLVVDGDGARPGRYWEPDLGAALPVARERDLAEAYLSILGEEVRRCSRSQAPVAFEVSGGLDSSALFCLASRLQASGGLLSPDLEGYTLLVDDGSAADEIEYARAVGRFAGRPLHEVPPSRMPIGWYRERAEESGDFPGYLNGTMFLEMKALAHRRGCRVVVTGEGGDQWLGGERTAYAETLRSGQFRHFLRLFGEDAKARGVRKGMLGVLRDGLFPLLPPPVAGALRSAARRARGVRATDGTCPWLTPRMNDLLRQRRQRAARTDTRRVGRVGQRRQLEVLEDPFGDHVMEVNERLTARLGLECRNPFLSPAVVQLAFSVPERLRRSGERNKLLHVEAFRGLMPRLVLDRRSKADFAPVLRPQLDALEGAFVHELPEELRDWVEPDGLRALFRTYATTPRAGWPIWGLSSVLGCREVLRAAELARGGSSRTAANP